MMGGALTCLVGSQQPLLFNRLAHQLVLCAARMSIVVVRAFMPPLCVSSHCERKKEESRKPPHRYPLPEGPIRPSLILHPASAGLRYQARLTAKD